MWDTHPAKCRQLTGIGRLLGDKLVAAGYGDLRAIVDGDARLIERAAGKAYPWGDERQSDARAMLPARCSLNISVSGSCRSLAPPQALCRHAASKCFADKAWPSIDPPIAQVPSLAPKRR